MANGNGGVMRLLNDWSGLWTLVSIIGAILFYSISTQTALTGISEVQAETKIMMDRDFRSIIKSTISIDQSLNNKKRDHEMFAKRLDDMVEVTKRQADIMERQAAIMIKVSYTLDNINKQIAERNRERGNGI